MDLFIVESGKYRILSELGRGGMGVVYLAEDSLLKRRVALKVLYEHLCRDPQFVQRFQEEARSVSTLHHPNIVCVHGLDKSTNVYMIDMEYVEGLSLDKFTDSARIAPPLAARVGSDILEGLVACHGIGIVHRDIKPSNILIDREGIAKITDFGLATAYATHVTSSITGGTSGGFFMGTPRYAPPAAWDGGSPEPDWDLYSLGVILFELLSGRVAFAGETPMAIIRQHLTARLPPLREANSTLSEELTTLVDRLLDSGQGKDSLTSLEARESLRETPEFAASRERDCATTISVAVRRRGFRRSARSYRPLAVKGMVTMLVLLLLGGAFWFGRRGEGPATTGPSLSDSVVFLRPHTVSTGEEKGVWMLSNAKGGGPERIVALTALGLWQLHLAPSAKPGRYMVTGNWAEYIRPAPGAFRFGTVEGNALFETDERRVTLSIELLNDRDGTRAPLNLIAIPVDDGYDLPSFVRELESNEAAQNLLYAELLARRLPWAEEVEALMPSFPAGRVVVPLATTDIAVDGVLDETLWAKPIIADGRRTGEMTSGESRLLVRWSPEAVILAIDANKAPVGARLEIGLVPGVEVSFNNAQRFFATVTADGIARTYSTAGSHELDWECDWSAAAVASEGKWRAEIQIPTEQFTDMVAPVQDRRWRLSAVLKGADGGAPIVVWGSGDGSQPEHGALLIFGGPVK